jgi:hypothetical protein
MFWEWKALMICIRSTLMEKNGLIQRLKRKEIR